MSRRKTNDLIEFVFLIIFLISFTGFKNTIQIVYDSFKFINDITIQLCSSSILTIMFKYFITFPIVGILLVKMGSPRGKTGRFIGKVLYFIVGYGIGLFLDIIANLIL